MGGIFKIEPLTTTSKTKLLLIHKKESILFNYQWFTEEPHTPIFEDNFNEYWASIPYKRK